MPKSPYGTPRNTSVLGDPIQVMTLTGSSTMVSGSVVVTQTAGSNLHMALDSGTLTGITNPISIIGTVTSSVSGSVTANAGTNLNTSLLALEAGGNLATLVAKDFATQTTLAALNAKVTAVNTGAVVVSSSALPTGAATDARQDTGNTSLATIAAKDFATQTTLAALNTKVTVVDTGNVTVVAMPTVTVQATNLDVRDLSSATDSAEVAALVAYSEMEYADAAVEPLSLTRAARLRVQTQADALDVPQWGASGWSGNSTQANSVW